MKWSILEKYIKLLNYNEKIRLEEDLLFKYGVDITKNLTTNKREHLNA